MSENALVELLYNHVISCHQNNEDLIKFMLLVEESSGMKIETPKETRKCDQRKCSVVKAYMYGISIPQGDADTWKR